MSDTQFFDIDGNPVSLDTLCKRDPAWAANRIRTERAQARAEITMLRELLVKHDKDGDFWHREWASAKVSSDAALAHVVALESQVGSALKTIIAANVTTDMLLQQRATLAARVTALEALLARCIKYAREDRMRTPGKTRLARALADAERVLAAERGDPPVV
jgi:hypothetical protein